MAGHPTVDRWHERFRVGSHGVLERSTRTREALEQLSIVYEPVENGWTQARIAEYPPVITAAPTREGAKEMVLDALREYLLSLTEQVGPDQGEREPVAVTISA